MRDASYDVFISVFVHVVEIVTGFSSVRIFLLDYPSMIYGCRDVAAVIVHETGEYFVWTAFHKSHEGNPVFLAVAEPYDIGFEGYWPLARMAVGVFLLLLVGDKHAGA